MKEILKELHESHAAIICSVTWILFEDRKPIGGVCADVIPPKGNEATASDGRILLPQRPVILRAMARRLYPEERFESGNIAQGSH